MSKLEDVQKFIDLAHRVAKPEDLHALLDQITRDMGFDHFALIHHVDLRPLGAHKADMITGDFVALSTYPDSWVEQYISKNIVSNDPILLASQRTNVGFGWQDVGELITVTEAHRRITELTRKAGIRDGFTVPANVPGELNGSCNFATGMEKDAPRENFAMAQLVGSFAFQAARALVARMQNLPKDARVKLTPRQLECIVLVARGKSDWEIGQILGLSEQTVKDYLKDARARYDVPKRIQVVMRAVYDGLIPFSELF